mmetsp:Transcript_21470/g.46419  ORF Transcript_21470/g.46419 Transcript_21470/m.46419 type:complete len:344 (-) Transcript_21470:29-1060(-)
MRLTAASALLLPASTAAFFANPPFFDHTHSTGFAKRSRAASTSKIYTNFDIANRDGVTADGGRRTAADADTTGSPPQASPSPSRVPADASTSSIDFDLVTKPSDLAREEGRARLMERFSIEISDDDRAVLAELSNKISQHMNPYSALFDSNLKNNGVMGGGDATGIDAASKSGTGTDVTTDDVPQIRPDYVHIILFNPQTEREGMHSIEYPKGSGNNLVLAFESKAECDNFSSQLSSDLFSDPVTYEMDLDSLEAYCNALGVFVQVVPTGTDIRPPNTNAPVMGHDPNLTIEKLALDYLFDMAEMTSEVDHDDSLGDAGGRWLIEDLEDEGIAYLDGGIGCWD